MVLLVHRRWRRAGEKRPREAQNASGLPSPTSDGGTVTVGKKTWISVGTAAWGDAALVRWDTITIWLGNFLSSHRSPPMQRIPFPTTTPFLGKGPPIPLSRPLSASEQAAAHLRVEVERGHWSGMNSAVTPCEQGGWWQSKRGF